MPPTPATVEQKLVADASMLLCGIAVALLAVQWWIFIYPNDHDRFSVTADSVAPGFHWLYAAPIVGPLACANSMAGGWYEANPRGQGERCTFCADGFHHCKDDVGLCCPFDSVCLAGSGWSADGQPIGRCSVVDSVDGSAPFFRRSPSDPARDQPAVASTRRIHVLHEILAILTGSLLTIFGVAGTLFSGVWILEDLVDLRAAIRATKALKKTTAAAINAPRTVGTSASATRVPMQTTGLNVRSSTSPSAVPASTPVAANPAISSTLMISKRKVQSASPVTVANQAASPAAADAGWQVIASAESKEE